MVNVTWLSASVCTFTMLENALSITAGTNSQEENVIGGTEPLLFILSKRPETTDSQHMPFIKIKRQIKIC